MKRPWQVTFLGLLFIVVGLAGLIYHLTDRPRDRSIVLISLFRILAVVGGFFLLKGYNWARWLLIAWLAFHVVVGALHSFWQTITHLVLLLVIAYFLLWSPASKYFRSASSA
jgi:uncharacterized membrane protein